MHALDGFTFDAEPGERIALLGPSGAGKTTLFRLLNATLRPTSGTLQFDGTEVGAMSGRQLRSMRRRIGTIYQQYYLVPSLTALENTLCGRLGYWSFLHTVRSAVQPMKEERDQAMEALETVGLSDKHCCRADELSGGQQQRLAIARVFMQDPEVILADEPFSSLDPSLKETLASLLIVLVTNSRRTLVATLHDVETALRFFPRIIALRDGRVAFDKPASEVDRTTLEALYSDHGESKTAPVSQTQEADDIESRCAPVCTQ
ncbi:MAG TPA: phosphonate ABC transporter ATP-binding protein [Pyrinomonadaceae bacterium]|nr:phosphonate ABC transporter ATP-binding protein [Pyrinomonadaceae bacterium]